MKNRQISLEEMIAEAEAARKLYDKVREDVWFKTLYPTLSGDWNKDEVEWLRIYEILKDGK